MTDDKARDEKLQTVFTETAKMSALSSCKIDKYEYLTSQDTLYSSQIQMTKCAKFIYFSLGKAF